MENMLSVEGLSVSFSVRGRLLRAVRGVDLTVPAGETLAVVGESGCGKSALAKAVMGLTDRNGRIDAGRVTLNGMTAQAGDPPEAFARLRRSAAMVLQDPMTSLDPLKRVGWQIAEAVRLHSGCSWSRAGREAVRLLQMVGIPRAAERARQWPHEFSGGMRQRAVIAAAMACRPRLLICDEPTTALDVTVQSRVLDLLLALQREHGLSMLFITHDLGVVASVADRVAVMYAGEIVEQATADELFSDARHPYTWALLNALPQLHSRGRPLSALPGSAPVLYDDPPGDAFAPRNPYALHIDFEQPPPVFSVSPTHTVKSWLADPRAPRVRPSGMRRQPGL